MRPRDEPGIASPLSYNDGSGTIWRRAVRGGAGVVHGWGEVAFDPATVSATRIPGSADWVRYFGAGSRGQTDYHFTGRWMKSMLLIRLVGTISSGFLTQHKKPGSETVSLRR